MSAARDPYPSNRRTSAFERRVEAALRDSGVGAPVVVAASGGPDSTAALVAVTRALGPGGVTAAHFDHRLRTRGEAEREASAVAEVAAALGVSVVTGRARARGGASEAAAREARYRWLARACWAAAAHTCITGHTLDDQAETVLLRLARGAGALGAAGMRPLAEWPVPVRGAARLAIARPLLEISRAEVEAYLEALGIEAAEDRSNQSPAYARNRVRLQVMPALRDVNDRAAEHLAEFASSQREDDAALTDLAREWLAHHVRLERPDCIEVDRRALAEAPPAVALRVLREAAGRLGVALESRHLHAVRGILGRRGASVDLPLARSETDGTILRLRTRPSPAAPSSAETD